MFKAIKKLQSTFYLTKYLINKKRQNTYILPRITCIVLNFILNKISMVRDRRFELPRPKIGHKILSLARLPIPPIPLSITIE